MPKHYSRNTPRPQPRRRLSRRDYYRLINWTSIAIVLAGLLYLIVTGR